VRGTAILTYPFWNTDPEGVLNIARLCGASRPQRPA